MLASEKGSKQPRPLMLHFGQLDLDAARRDCVSPYVWICEIDFQEQSESERHVLANRAWLTSREHMYGLMLYKMASRRGVAGRSASEV